MPVPTPSSPEYFDYGRVARAAGITDDQLRALVCLFEADYPSDLMLRELHILRACNAVKEGRATIGTILESAGGGGMAV